ncbi:MAG TPA: hypothetical protein VFB36_14690 [Nevskiaceae bacterium]|nr:hypothetical protein [Nevskiaceae bacterium]
MGRVGGQRLRAACVVALALIATACANKVPRIAPSAQIWDRNVAVGVAMMPLPAAAAYKEGSQGLLDIAINSAMASDLDSHLSRLDVTGIDQAGDQIIGKLESRGVRAQRISEAIDPERFPKSGGDGKHTAERNYDVLATRYGVQRLVLIQLASVGTTRHYFGFVPTSSPKGYARATAQMIDLRTGELLWSAASVRRQDVADEWDQPPAFPNVDRAIADTLRAVAHDLASDLAF